MKRNVYYRSWNIKTRSSYPNKNLNILTKRNILICINTIGQFLTRCPQYLFFLLTLVEIVSFTSPYFWHIPDNKQAFDFHVTNSTEFRTKKILDT